MRQQTKIYLDTSVINYLYALRMPQQMQDTLDLWELFITGSLFEVVLSEIVHEELQACYEPKRTRLIEKLSELDYELVAETEEVIALVGAYVEFEVLPLKHYYDLLHIAHATASHCKLILSWNFKHFVNFRTMDRVNAVNLVYGYDPIRIVSPSMLLGELDYER